MPIDVQPYNQIWPAHFAHIAATVRPAIAHIPNASIEHVGSTSVAGLAAKPIIDIDIIVDPDQIPTAIDALATIGYIHRGNPGVPGREAFYPPYDTPKHHLYLCERDCLSLRNHLAVRDILRQHPDLRDRYAAVKLALAADPTMDIDTYVDGKCAILQQILLLSHTITPDERASILGVNTAPFPPRSPS